MDGKHYHLLIEPKSEDIKMMYSERLRELHGDLLAAATPIVFTDENAGFDLMCPDEVVIPAKALKVKIDLGIRAVMLKVVDGKTSPTHFSIRPRSSMADTPLMLGNLIGTIDLGYRGNLILKLRNLGDADYTIQKGDKLVQVVTHNLKSFHVSLTSYDLKKRYPSKRGTKGFGSTGR